MEPTFDLFVDQTEGHTIISTSLLDDLAAAGRQRFEEARLPPMFSEYWNGRPPPTSLKNIRRQKTMSDLRPHSMGAEPSVTTLEEQLEQSIKEKERLFKTNQDLEAQLVALKEELNSASKDSECAADESADEASKQKLVEELGRAKALVKVANLQLENLRGIALLSGSFEADLKKEKEQHAKTKQRLEVAETAACDLTDKALMASNIEEELRKEKEEHAKTKQSLELAQTPTHTLSEEHMCNISQDGTISVNKSILNDSSSSGEEDVVADLNKQISDLQQQLSRNSSDLDEQVADLQQQLSKKSSAEALLLQAREDLDKRTKELELLKDAHKQGLEDLDKQSKELEMLKDAHSKGLEWLKDAHSKEIVSIREAVQQDAEKLTKQQEILKDDHTKEIASIREKAKRDAERLATQQGSLMKDLSTYQQRLLDAEKEFEKLSAAHEELKASLDLEKEATRAKTQLALDLQGELAQTKRQLGVAENRVSVLEGICARGSGAVAPATLPPPAPLSPPARDPTIDAELKLSEQRREQLEAAQRLLRTLISQVSTCVNYGGSLELDLRGDMMRAAEAPPPVHARPLPAETPTLCSQPLQSAPRPASSQALTSEPPSLPTRPLSIRSEIPSRDFTSNSPSAPVAAATARPSTSWSTCIDLSGVTATCRPLNTSLLDGGNRRIAAPLGSYVPAGHTSSFGSSEKPLTYLAPASATSTARWQH